MLDNIELHHLKAFNAIYECKNITVASEKLNISQQALSAKLRKIRLELGDPLFVKSGHGVIPTSYAEKIYPFVQKALSSIVQIPLPSDENPHMVKKVVTISATDFLQEIIVSKLVARLSITSPLIKFKITNIESSELARKLGAGEIDLALTSEGYVPDGMLKENLFLEQYRCVTSNAKQFTEFPVSVLELSKHKFIVTNPGVASFAGSAHDWFKRKDSGRDVSISSPSFTMTKQIVKQTDYLAFIPSRLLPDNGLTELDIESPPPGFQTVLAFHPSQATDPVLNFIKNIILEMSAV